MHEYDQIAEWYASTRSPTVGVPDVAAFVRPLPPGARVLDLGCGDGAPITRLLVREGFAVTALDSSAEMIRRLRAGCPGVTAQRERAEEARFPAGSFEAVVAWGVLFHLSAADQRSLIPRVAEWLAPGGRFLFTSADAEGTREGVMDGVTFQYVSLGRDEYGRLLTGAGAFLVEDYTDAWGNHTYVAAKTA